MNKHFSYRGNAPKYAASAVPDVEGCNTIQTGTVINPMALVTNVLEFNTVSLANLNLTVGGQYPLSSNSNSPIGAQEFSVVILGITAMQGGVTNITVAYVLGGVQYESMMDVYTFFGGNPQASITKLMLSDCVMQSEDTHEQGCDYFSVTSKLQTTANFLNVEGGGGSFVTGNSYALIFPSGSEGFAYSGLIELAVASSTNLGGGDIALYGAFIYGDVEYPTAADLYLGLGLAPSLQWSGFEIEVCSEEDDLPTGDGVTGIDDTTDEITVDTTEIEDGDLIELDIPDVQVIHYCVSTTSDDGTNSTLTGVFMYDGYIFSNFGDVLDYMGEETPTILAGDWSFAVVSTGYDCSGIPLYTPEEGDSESVIYETAANFSDIEITLTTESGMLEVGDVLDFNADGCIAGIQVLITAIGLVTNAGMQQYSIQVLYEGVEYNGLYDIPENSTCYFVPAATLLTLSSANTGTDTGAGDNDSELALLQATLDNYVIVVQDAYDILEEAQTELEATLANCGTGEPCPDAEALQDYILQLETNAETASEDSTLAAYVNLAIEDLTSGNVDPTIIQNLTDLGETQLVGWLQTIQAYNDGVTQSGVDAVQADLNAANAVVSDLEAQLADALANQEDGVSQSDVDAVQADLDAANAVVSDLEAQVDNMEVVSEVSLTQDQYDAALLAAASAALEGYELVSEVSLTQDEYEAALVAAASAALEGYELISDISLTQQQYDDIIAAAVAEGLIGYEQVSEVSLTQAELDAQLALAASNALIGYELISDVSLTQQEYDDAIAAAVAEGLIGYEQVSEVSLTQQEYDDIIAAAVAEGLIGYEQVSEVSLTQAELDAQLASAASAALEGYELISDVSLTQAQYDAAIAAATDAGVASVTPEDGITQADVEAAELGLNNIIDGLEDQLGLLQAEIGQYAVFSTQMGNVVEKLEAFLVDKYDYQRGELGEESDRGYDTTSTYGENEQWLSPPQFAGANFTGGSAPLSHRLIKAKQAHLNFIGRDKARDKSALRFTANKMADNYFGADGSSSEGDGLLKKTAMVLGVLWLGSIILKK